jgi:hypothetical protein
MTKDALEWGEPHYFVEVKNGKVNAKYNAKYYGIAKAAYLDFAKEFIVEADFGMKALQSPARVDVEGLKIDIFKDVDHIDDNFIKKRMGRPVYLANSGWTKHCYLSGWNDCIDHLVSQGYLTAKEGGWQPIETAPRDQKIIVAKFGENEAGEDLGFWWASTGIWSEKRKAWTDGIEKLAGPTHWRLP